MGIHKISGKYFSFFLTLASNWGFKWPTLASRRYLKSPSLSSNPSPSEVPNKPCLEQCSLGNPETAFNYAVCLWKPEKSTFHRNAPPTTEVGWWNSHIYERLNYFCKHDGPGPGHKLGSADSEAEKKNCFSTQFYKILVTSALRIDHGPVECLVCHPPEC